MHGGRMRLFICMKKPAGAMRRIQRTGFIVAGVIMGIGLSCVIPCGGAFAQGDGASVRSGGEAAQDNVLEANVSEENAPEGPDADHAEFTPLPRNWDFILYGGKFVDVTFRRVLFKGETDYIPSYVWVAGLNYKLGKLVGPITIETEGQVARHTGIQDNWEVNALLIARQEWIWGNAFSFSLAMGDGFSLASEVPVLEKKENPATNVFLQYLLAEMVFGLPSVSWHPRFLIRIHHRSGAFGIHCSGTCGSNFVTYGFKAAF